MVERDEYMREGFDANSLTMPQLRGILVEHKVSFSSAARKADLVDLFISEVLPKTASLRKKNASIVASSSGIIDMRDEATPDQTPAKRKPGRPRKSEAATPSSAATSKTPAKTPARTPGRKKSSLSNRVATSAESEAETDTKQVKSEPEEVEVPVKKKRAPRKTAPAVVSAPVEASDPEDNATSRRVSFDPNTSPPAPASASRKVGRLSYGAGARSDDDGIFSDTNPFQSGSEASPAPGVAAKAAASTRKARRKTTDGNTTLRKKTSSSSLPADSPPKQAKQSSPSVATTLRNYMDQAVAKSTPPRIVTGTTSADSTGGHAADDEATVSRAKHTAGDTGADAADDEDDGDFDLDTFTSPSALAKMRNLRRKRDNQRHREQRSGKSLADYLVNFGIAAVAVGVLAWTVWYATETRALGFCDTGSDTNSIVEDRRLTALAYAQANNETLDDITLLPARLQPACTPCPAHADCAYGKVLGCSSDDWVLQSNLRSHIPLANVVLPLGMTAPRCYPDTQKLVLASELAQAISSMLAEFKGEIVCGTQKTHATIRTLPKKLVGAEGNLTYAIAEGAVKRSMSATRDVGVDEEYFEQIWYMALFELTDPRSNVVRIPIANGTLGEGTGEGTQFFLAAKQPALSLSCRSRLALKGWMVRARLYVFVLLAVGSGLLYLRYRLAAARAENGRVALLVQTALEKLQEQEYLHGRDPVLHPDDFVPLSHLRDHILSDVHHAGTRNRLWRKVAKVVEENSNVRTRQAQKKGEWLRVWQWIGLEGWRGYEANAERTVA